MNAIASVTSDWGIGHDGGLLVPNKQDMRRFVKLTMGGTVVMGRKTLESLPGQRPLKGRRNVVLSARPHYRPSGFEVAASVDEALELVRADDPSRVWVMGGATVYEALLPHCDRAYLTMNHVVVEADTYFPDLDEAPDWRLTEKDAAGTTADGVPFSYLLYERASASLG